MKNRAKEIRFDLIVNHCYATIDVVRSSINQLTPKLIGGEVQCLRKFYLKRQFEVDLLDAIDQHHKEKILPVPVIKVVITSRGNLERTDGVGHSDLRSKLKILFFSLRSMSPLLELQEMLTRSLANRYLLGTLQPRHRRVICSSFSMDESLDDRHLFQQLINRLDNYYIHQQVLVLVFVLSHLIRSVHQRRPEGEHR